jgi:hypothetical protein
MHTWARLSPSLGVSEIAVIGGPAGPAATRMAASAFLLERST